VNPSGLGGGTYSGTLTITPSSGTPAQVTVTLTVTVVSVLTATPASLSLTCQVPCASTTAATLQVSSTPPSTFVASATTQILTNWLVVTPISGSTPGTLTVSANAGTLSPGAYSGTIAIFPASGNATMVPVTLSVTTPPTLTVTPASLSFAYQSGAAPAPAAVQVSGSSSAETFAVSVTTQSGGNWLAVTPAAASTPMALSVSVNPSGLSGGTYNGTVTISRGNETPLAVAVGLTVTTPPTVTAAPTSLSFAYQSSGALPAPATLQVSGSASAVAFIASTATQSGGVWLTVSSTSGSTPATLSVSADPTGLTSGTYTGTVTITGTNGATGSTTVGVTLTVALSAPTISAVTNAASSRSGPIAPGEMVSIFGTAIGPPKAVSLTLNKDGTVATSLGGVQALFNNIPAPLTYVSGSQINAVVPYEMAGLLVPYVQIKYLGQTSNVISLTAAPASPALFTVNGSGTGSAVILNQDYSPNGPTHPAARGSYVVLYLTGEGQTSPPGVTGSVTAVSSKPPPLTPQPLLPVAVLIDGQPASVTFDGEAPTFISGILQINIQIPMNLPSGDLPIQVLVGTSSTQGGVTISVQ